MVPEKNKKGMHQSLSKTNMPSTDAESIYSRSSNAMKLATSSTPATANNLSPLMLPLPLIYLQIIHISHWLQTKCTLLLYTANKNEGCEKIQISTLANFKCFWQIRNPSDFHGLSAALSNISSASKKANSFHWLHAE